MGLYGDDVIEEYAFQCNGNVAGKVTSSNVHLIVGHLH